MSNAETDKERVGWERGERGREAGEERERMEREKERREKDPQRKAGRQSETGIINDDLNQPNRLQAIPVCPLGFFFCRFLWFQLSYQESIRRRSPPFFCGTALISFKDWCSLVSMVSQQTTLNHAADDIKSPDNDRSAQVSAALVISRNAKVRVLNKTSQTTGRPEEGSVGMFHNGTSTPWNHYSNLTFGTGISWTSWQRWIRNSLIFSFPTIQRAGTFPVIYCLLQHIFFLQGASQDKNHSPAYIYAGRPLFHIFVFYNQDQVGRISLNGKRVLTKLNDDSQLCQSAWSCSLKMLVQLFQLLL